MLTIPRDMMASVNSVSNRQCLHEVTLWQAEEDNTLECWSWTYHRFCGFTVHVDVYKIIRTVNTRGRGHWHGMLAAHSSSRPSSLLAMDSMEVCPRKTVVLFACHLRDIENSSLFCRTAAELGTIPRPRGLFSYSCWQDRLLILSGI